ncbi:methionine aminopeptidase 1D, mitochondrial isoform X3 [Salminus brasiliensis]|uniref:methionine aminopeptidase 1D, mitochondrial isoform X3 n=1 Tax=Salminus brasiliensis TaxID=930266 RepID=UPI003B82E187
MAAPSAARGVFVSGSGLLQRAAARLPRCQQFAPAAQCPPRRFFRKKRTGSYSVVQPALVRPPYVVSKDIKRPDYVSSCSASEWPDYIEIKDEEQIKSLRNACQLARHILLLAGNSLKVGMTTEAIDFIVHSETIRHNAYPSPLHYGGFPKSVCTSVNNVLCHGIPDSRPLEDGDIINIDVTVYLDGYHGDTSETFLIGSVDRRGRELVEVARRCRDQAIAACGPGKPLCVIGNTIRLAGAVLEKCSVCQAGSSSLPRDALKAAGGFGEEREKRGHAEVHTHTKLLPYCLTVSDQRINQVL